ncbi:hypothetical protein [Ruegeria sp. TM1040]|uniref:hypothetical protein n=1 Tax=Ruegeria sp. (strain TM1040) TaxID=292414 RepID=UPI0002EC6918|nr:hypothetical protein [Ruegeria sp. TM1040]
MSPQTLLRQRIEAHRRAIRSGDLIEINRTWDDLEHVVEYAKPAEGQKKEAA